MENQSIEAVETNKIVRFKMKIKKKHIHISKNNSVDYFLKPILEEIPEILSSEIKEMKEIINTNRLSSIKNKQIINTQSSIENKQIYNREDQLDNINSNFINTFLTRSQKNNDSIELDNNNNNSNDNKCVDNIDDILEDLFPSNNEYDDIIDYNQSLKIFRNLLTLVNKITNKINRLQHLLIKYNIKTFMLFQPKNIYSIYNSEIKEIFCRLAIYYSKRVISIAFNLSIKSLLRMEKKMALRRREEEKKDVLRIG